VGVQRLIAFVALHEEPASRQSAAFTLWPEASERQAYGNLRATMFRLRAITGGTLLEHGPELALCAGVHVDVRRAYALVAARRGSATTHTDMTELEAILLAGELLPDWYDDWVLLARERFHELRLHELGELCNSHLRSGEVSSALACALAAVHADPVRESSTRALIRVHLWDGNRAAALAHARQFSELLRQLGLTPSPRFDDLIRSVKRA
jgi:DNA-binding SARP family transcriptional activator